MHINVDLSTSPAQVKLVEPEDFRAFDVVLEGSGAREEGLAQLGPLADDGDHVFVEPERLEELAGELASDPEWLGGLEKMTAYAAEHGWVDEAGRIRAHVIAS